MIAINPTLDILEYLECLGLIPFINAEASKHITGSAGSVYLRNLTSKLPVISMYGTSQESNITDICEIFEPKR